jgi:hypothetical protein
MYELRKRDTGFAAGWEEAEERATDALEAELDGALLQLQIEASVEFLGKCELGHTEAN